MIPNVSKSLSWLRAHPEVLKNISRGIERETLRIQPNGCLATTRHPQLFGSALKHDWITTDFAEALLEFITPVNNNIDYMLSFLRDIHRYVSRNLLYEFMWPFSMPCIIDNPNNIQLAQYGISNIGKMKTLYREGLKNRYGALMQIICGVHYNFSLPLLFWQKWANVKNSENGKEKISSGYLSMIRNYYRFGWITSYLFGASPAVCSSFLQDCCQNNFLFENNYKGTLWLPYATSLRLSNLGYNNKLQSNLNITFNSLNEYVTALKLAVKTPSKKYLDMDAKSVHGKLLQLNTNILQIENELYTPIRPKRIIQSGESLSDSLLDGGIEYIEVRSLDINPFSAIGINADQIRFLDLLLIWCILADSRKMSVDELLCIRRNWNRVVLEGRKPGQVIIFDNIKSQNRLVDIGKALLNDFYYVAEILDINNGNNKYEQVCNKLITVFDNPDLTYSARLLKDIKENGLAKTGIILAKKYSEQLCNESLEVITEADFNYKAYESLLEQKKLEQNDTLDFESYLLNF